MCLFSVLAAEADAIPASACLLSLNQTQLMSVSEGTKNFHHSFKRKMVRNHKTRPSTTFTLPSFSSSLFNNVYCSFHYYPQSTESPTILHSLFSFCQPRTILSTAQTQICLLGLLFGPHTSPKVHGLMNCVCWGHGFRTLVIRAFLLSMFMASFDE